MAKKAFKMTDRGLKILEKRKKSLAGAELKVGFPADIQGHGDLSPGELALILEFGTLDGRIPERPVFRQTFDELKAEIPQKQAYYAAMVDSGKISSKQAQQRLGQWYAGKLRWAIIRYHDVPNAPATIKQKGFDDPWIDTGGLVNAIDYRVK